MKETGIVVIAVVTAYNKQLCGSLPSVAHPNFAFGGASHTRQPLCYMPLASLNENFSFVVYSQSFNREEKI